MSEGLGIWRCTQCRTSHFPEPLLCRKCHNGTFEGDRVAEATVEEISTIRHMIGQTDWKPRRIASVRTAEDLLITIGLADESGPGSRVALYQEGEAGFGRAKAS